MIKKITAVGTGVSIFLCFCGAQLYAADSIQITKQDVDHATLNVGRISKDAPLYVQLFDSSNADLGKPKHRDTAELLARSAPHLLAVDIVETLRDAGFSNVVLDEAAADSTEQHLTLTGRITDLNPGSQAARAWIGFGAGKSKVCIEGQISDEAGKLIGNFSHCRSGLGWGNSGDQMESSAARIGDNVALFLTAWANGDYSRQ